MIISARKVIDHSVILAASYKIPALVIGLVFISLGTDLPEIVNSIISSSVGHTDINIGDSVGSVLIQLTLVFGLFILIGGCKKIKRKEVIVIGSGLLLALFILYNVLHDGNITRLNAFTIIVGWFLLTIISVATIGKQEKTYQEYVVPAGKKWKHVLILVLGLIGVGAGSYFTVESTITIARALRLSEYFISFFLVGLGTSLPELVVDITAIRNKQYDLAIGDILGSCLIDASLSLAIGPLLFPQKFSITTAQNSILYTIGVSVIVVFLLALRGKVDRKFGVLLLIFYLVSFFIIFM